MQRMIAVVSGTVLVSAAPIAECAGAQELPAPLKLREVPFTQVRIDDAFWKPRRDINRSVSLRHSLEMLERTGNLANFDLAAANAHSGYNGPVFSDSDLYKTLESVSYSLATDPDPQLDKQLDAIIARIAAAQRPDGYLNTWHEVNAPQEAFSNLRDRHELYCAGHLFEAAAAHFQATGKRNLLDIATKYADCIDRTFGPPPKRMGYCGHPEIELALVKLWRVTDERRYFDLAKFFLDSRGSHFFATEHSTSPEKYDGRYWQDACPLRELDAVTGHAVRLGYLMSAAVDVGVESNDAAMLQMTDRVWRNATERNMYVTGGIGSSAANEGFTHDYDLPNRSAYQETCASVAMSMWNHRLNLAYGDSKYADLMELALYNAVLAGVSLDGLKFFYVNPLESRGSHHRQEWYSCACCPPNVTRTLAALGNYAYATSSNALWVNMYIAGGVTTKVGASDVALDVATDYPWDGRISITLQADAKSALRLRVPGWCTEPALKVNGIGIGTPRMERGYIVLDRAWTKGDRVELDLPMPARRIEANPNVVDDRGLLAIARGPLVYCIEGMDSESPFWSFAIPAGTDMKPEKRSDLLGGVTVLRGEAIVSADPDWASGNGLYRAAPATRKVAFTAIPYCLWDNRENAGPMRVWMPGTLPPAGVNGPEGKARVSLSWVSDICDPEAIHDGIEPRNSGDHPGNLCHWWPHKGSNGGGNEWVQYTWDKPMRIKAASVYWFDDTGKGECRLPKSWALSYRETASESEAWKPVALRGEYSIAKDHWCEVTFTQPIAARQLRLSFTMQDGWSVGIHEWKVMPAE